MARRRAGLLPAPGNGYIAVAQRNGVKLCEDATTLSEASTVSQSSSTRRDFLRSSAALAAGGAIAPYWFTSESARADAPKAKNDRPHIAQIGCGGQGTRVTELAARFGDEKG